ncbi:hypothetical protein T484DRAFT_1648375, partial [Baffinella frigidus]
IPNPESRIPNPESRIPNPESRIPNPESRIPNPEPKWVLVRISRSAPSGNQHVTFGVSGGGSVIYLPKWPTRGTNDKKTLSRRSGHASDRYF